jgi:hypothetical protein
MFVQMKSKSLGHQNLTQSAIGAILFFTSIAYRADLQAQSVDLSPFIRYDISRIKIGSAILLA